MMDGAFPPEERLHCAPQRQDDRTKLLYVHELRDSSIVASLNTNFDKTHYPKQNV